jgi:hypothetical protein
VRPQLLTLSSSLLLLLSGVGCQESLTQDLSLSPEVRRPRRAAIIFFVDGLDVRCLERLLKESRLPNIQRVFAEGGCRVENAYSCLPTVTYANTVSLLTGRFPGRHGITGNAWFDRSTLAYRDYSNASDYVAVDQDYETPTLYELVLPAVSISTVCPTARGAARRFREPIANGLDWMWGRYMDVDHRSASRIVRVFQGANESGEWPLIQTYYFPGLDETGHRYGIESSQYESYVVHADELIGSIYGKIRDAGLMERTYFFLVSDHGHVEVPANRRIDLAERLANAAQPRILVSAERLPGWAPSRAGLLADADAVLLCADRYSFVFVGGRHDWAATPAAEDVEQWVDDFLIPVREGETESVERRRRVPEWIGLIAAKLPPNRLLLLSSDEETVVDLEDLAPGEPRAKTLGSESAAPVVVGDSSFSQPTPRDSHSVGSGPSIHPSTEPIHRDKRLQHELAVLLGSDRSGDIVVFAADNWAFRDRGASTHGSHLQTDRRIPCFVAGPGIAPHSRIAHGRIVDVTPTILDLLGYADRIPPDLDGVSLAPLLHAGGIDDRAAPPALRRVSPRDR